MDGWTLLRRLRELLAETDGSEFLDDRTSYDYLYEGARRVAFATSAWPSFTTITTVADQATYILPGDYLGPYLKDDSNQRFIKYNDGSSDYWLYWSDYDQIVLNNESDSVTIPSSFTIKMADASSRIEGTATATNTSSQGEVILEDSAASFTDDTVAPGDLVHNVDDDSHGVVLARLSGTQLRVALFDGTNNYFTVGDTYIITAISRHELMLAPPPASDGHIITLYYLKAPTPVYSPYRSYGFSPDCSEAMVNYAAWLYKYRDREPDYGDRLYMRYHEAIRHYNAMLNKARQRKRLMVNFRVSAGRDRTRWR
jgi:hypothetical protein